MNDSLKNLLKYLVYGVIIYLLIVVVPENKTETSETIMITFVAVGSYMILDSFCSSKRNLREGMEDDLDLDLDDLDLDLDLDNNDSKTESTAPKLAESVTPKLAESVSPKLAESVAPKVEESVAPRVEESVAPKLAESVAPRESVALNAYANKQEEKSNVDMSSIDSDVEPNMEGECDSVQSCRNKIKDVHSMYQKQINNIRKDHADKISELEDAKKDLDKLSDKNITSNRSDTRVTFGRGVSQSEGKFKDADTVTSVYKSTLGRAGTKEEIDEFKQTTNYVMNKMNLDDMTFDQLDDATKKQVMEQSQKLILRKQVMTELGVKETAYKDLPSSVKRKVDVMTMLAVDEAKGIVSDKSDDKLKQYVDDTSSKQTRLSQIREKRMKSNDQDWNESRYTEFPTEMTKPLGSYDDTMTNKWNHGYTYLSTDKWSVPMVRPPVCINTTPCNVCPSNTSGYPVNLMDFDSSRKISQTKMNKQYIKDKF